ncbi:glycoside hydrolase family 13 protein [Galbitalea sp. SE-J8]|uniref:glycoside hydrolase family 13 protein n=1 Tax=Galbitalea sp. SE-J8 TaxID=3054952 RepID=UPI00259D0E2C|nr:glycoside hydrolase family 13 protein [Galbitalea sp. SE-J8]MDM4762233.1 glycoside hydrolase family 13 protein [Galbitalea sp. SE-J8]
MSAPWWRDAVIYQIYPSSFADSTGSGIGDLPGITARLDAIAELGVDGIWLSPFYPSPRDDHGYDVADYCDIDPVFGTLADFSALVDRTHDLGLRLVIDIVPNHTSSSHRWFQDALASPPGSPARARYFFRDGRGEHGELPPNNWRSAFGGGAWTRVIEADGSAGQWYLHMFAPSQPDLDWRNGEVADEFDRVFRFWLDRGVDGFRIDVAHGMIKAEGLPDEVFRDDTMGLSELDAYHPPQWAQPEVHDIVRRWRRTVDEYPGDRLLCAEAWLKPIAALAQWARPDEMQHAFNFPYLTTPWSASALRDVVTETLAAFDAVGAASTWVLSNHDLVRHATRLAVPGPFVMGDGIGPRSPNRGHDPAEGLRRARAATAIMLALPGSAYVYQGEELGLPEVIDLPDDARQDPTFFRSGGASYGRDGCRVPIPWEADAPGYGFSPTGASWLPQPADWAPHARDVQRAEPDSTLHLYRRLLAERRRRSLGTAELRWLDSGADVLAFTVGAVTVIANLGSSPVPLPNGRVLVSSSPGVDAELPPSTAVWLAPQPA